MAHLLPRRSLPDWFASPATFYIINAPPGYLPSTRSVLFRKSEAINRFIYLGNVQLDVPLSIVLRETDVVLLHGQKGVVYQRHLLTDTHRLANGVDIFLNQP